MKFLGKLGLSSFTFDFGEKYLGKLGLLSVSFDFGERFLGKLGWMTQKDTLGHKIVFVKGLLGTSKNYRCRSLKAEMVVLTCLPPHSCSNGFLNYIAIPLVSFEFQFFGVMIAFGTSKATDALIRPFKVLIRRLKGLIRPLKGLRRPYQGLRRPVKGLIRVLRAL